MKGLKLKMTLGGLILVFSTLIVSTQVFAGSCDGQETIMIDCGGEEGICHVLNLVIKILTIGMGVLAVMGIMLVGMQYLTSGNNEEKLRKSKRRLVELVIGVVIYVLSGVLVQWLIPGGSLCGVTSSSGGGGGGGYVPDPTPAEPTPTEPTPAEPTPAEPNTVEPTLEENKYKVALYMTPGADAVEVLVPKNEVISKPTEPVVAGQKFVGWYDENQQEYDFTKPVEKNMSLYAQYAPKISYAMNKRGRWIFINNPEVIAPDVMANNGKLLYRGSINAGENEIYYEHGTEEVGSGGWLKTKYAIRFWNPHDKEVTMTINRCGASEPGVWDLGNSWRQYYNVGGQSCSIGGKTFIIPPKSSFSLFHANQKISTNEEDAELNYHILDGVINLSASDNLDMAALAYTGSYSDTFGARYDGNYTMNKNNNATYSRVYSGYYDMLPELESKSTYYINDGTSDENLKMAWENTYDEEVAEKAMSTHSGGGNLNYYCQVESIPVPKDTINLRMPLDSGTVLLGQYPDFKETRSGNYIVGRSCGSMDIKGLHYNWVPWAAHYNEEITIVNNASREKVVSYYIRVPRDGENDWAGQNLIVIYDGGMRHYKEIGDEKIWTTVVQPGEQQTMEFVLTLGGVSNGGVERYLKLD